MSLIFHQLDFERRYDAAPARVFAALADPAARERWAVPVGSRLVYDQSDFRPGGLDLCRCGPPDDLRYRVENRYLEIIPDRRIVLSETTRDQDAVLSHSLNATELEPIEGGTRLRLTVQIAAAEPDMIAGALHGYQAALDNLAVEITA
ncbi:MAG: SRPBCC domain-containing protein [Alphaproteobacteria bacterium]|nr:SRPBCC domain-containing protein [Alphaproteobacteria bacterium]MBU2270846.1 SRPBCC domain-containing protein [Alphaproteobacteria bacterium]MBU2417564.1 SRPBCC domain-containing protein [Alphaproteobacteria bacterium]